MNTAAVALSRLSASLTQPSAGEAAEAERIQRSIDATMREVLQTPNYNPQQRPGVIPQKGGAPIERGTGWRESTPLAPPPGQDLIGKLVDRALGPAVPAGKKG